VTAGWWRFLVGVGIGLLLLVLFLLSRVLRRRRNAHLEEIARALGCTFHGDSFRGRFLAHAVRGDAEDALPRGGMPQMPTFWDSARRALTVVSTELLRVFVGARASERTVRVRVELSSLGGKRPDAAGAAVALRRELKSRWPEAGLHEVSHAGTELLLLLRGEAAEPAKVKELVELAIGLAGGE
jgi:hypothetical protein